MKAVSRLFLVLAAISVLAAPAFAEPLASEQHVVANEKIYDLLDRMHMKTSNLVLASAERRIAAKIENIRIEKIQKTLPAFTIASAFIIE